VEIPEWSLPEWRITKVEPSWAVFRPYLHILDMTEKSFAMEKYASLLGLIIRNDAKTIKVLASEVKIVEHFLSPSIHLRAKS
jgi:hypothetical protein